ncbi:hypothetical protein CDAR_18841 [Caerostris darwini]|uniref:Uncharacterized protein n=1 Tax=Caerostris darwini TaxID=1538125 RepID=A0AAV4WDP4_9ARAC|nr:hypothetical protein CDAR_18841 [Caerostris darwini]
MPSSPRTSMQMPVYRCQMSTDKAIPDRGSFLPAHYPATICKITLYLFTNYALILHWMLDSEGRMNNENLSYIPHSENPSEQNRFLKEQILHSVRKTSPAKDSPEPDAGSQSWGGGESSSRHVTSSTPFPPSSQKLTAILLSLSFPQVTDDTQSWLANP